MNLIGRSFSYFVIPAWIAGIQIAGIKNDADESGGI